MTDDPEFFALIRAVRTAERDHADCAGRPLPHAGDAARLAFADWLNRRGDRDRAEAVRLAVALPPHLERMAELHAAHPEWFAVPPGAAVTAHAGFIESVRCSLAWWFAHGSEVCLRHPVRAVSLTDHDPPRPPMDAAALRWAEQDAEAEAHERNPSPARPVTRWAVS